MSIKTGVILKKKYVTISIPKELYDKINERINGTGFRSPTEAILFILRKNISLSETSKTNLMSLPYLADWILFDFLWKRKLLF